MSSLPTVLRQADVLGPAMALDLVLLAPLSYYLLSRKSRNWKFLTVPVLILSTTVGYHILPAQGVSTLQAFKQFGLPLVELLVVGIVGWKARQLFRSVKSSQERLPLDFVEVCMTATKEVLPLALARILTMELSMIYYGFVRWKKVPPNTNRFTYHLRSGTPALLGAFLLIIGVETLGLHFLLSKWSETIAWIITALSAYTGFQVFGIIRSMGQRMHELTEDELVLRYGLLASARIPLSQIHKMEKNARRLNPEETEVKLSPLGDLERHNVLITLKEPTQIQGLYGKPRAALVIGLHVDFPDDFVAAVSVVCRS